MKYKHYFFWWLILLSSVNCAGAKQKSQEIITQDEKNSTPTPEFVEVEFFSEEILLVNENIVVLNPRNLMVFDTKTLELIRLIQLENSMGGDDLLFDKNTIWVTRSDLSSMILSRVDLDNGTIVKEYNLEPTRVNSIAYGLDSIWISGFRNNEIKKIDLSTGSLNSFITLDFFSQKIAFANNKLWALDTQNNLVAVYNAITGEAIATYQTGEVPIDIAFDQSEAWIVNRDSDYITIVDFSLPENPETLELNCAPVKCKIGNIEIAESTIWISSLANDVVYQLDPDNGSFLRKYETRAPIDVIFDGKYLWVLNSMASRMDNANFLTKIPVD